MLTGEQTTEIRDLVVTSLDAAEAVWDLHGGALALDEGTRIIKAALEKRAEKVPSRIPSHPIVDRDKPIIDEFIAIAADIRGSSIHLTHAVPRDVKNISTGLQRVYYETSALLPAIEKTLGYKGAHVTEYLGDGILALLKPDKTDEGASLKTARRAARNCIDFTLTIVNDELKTRYRLAALSIGIGMAYSKALVSLVGLEGAGHAKAIGDCVYNATKLSDGRNEIIIDEQMRKRWPKSPGGLIKFTSTKRLNGASGYIVS